MKKVFSIILTALMAITLSACGSDAGKAAPKAPENNKEVSQQSEKASAKSKILVAYFSVNGHTKQLAESTAKALGADIYEIRPAQPYTAQDLNYNDESTRATVEQKNDNARPKLADNSAPIADHEIIILAHPIWWGQAPRIMDTFVESYDFTGKTVTNICTSGGSDIGTSGDYLAKLTKGKATWKNGKLFKAQATDSEIKDWFKGLGL